MNGPEKVTGGCNCGQIRYTISFPADAEWPPSNNGTCQCTLCRKFTGSLIPQSISVPTSSITPSLDTFSTYKQWKSPINGLRGFCTECGSSMTFQFGDKPHVTELYLGTIDEDVLLGKKTGKEEYIGESGPKSMREGEGYGALLARTDRSGHIWMENRIIGVTDGLPGLKYWKDRSGGLGWEMEEELHPKSPVLSGK